MNAEVRAPPPRDREKPRKKRPKIVPSPMTTDADGKRMIGSSFLGVYGEKSQGTAPPSTVAAGRLRGPSTRTRAQFRWEWREGSPRARGLLRRHAGRDAPGARRRGEESARNSRGAEEFDPAGGGDGERP